MDYLCKRYLTYPLLIFSWVFLFGCRYETAPNIDGEISTNGGSTASNIETFSLPDLELCNGECSCDDIDTQLNDTGSNFSALSDSDNLPYCDFSQNRIQDCNHGRDSDSVIDKTGAGNAAFDFSKVDNTGLVVSVAANDWQCVIDHQSGLMWEVKQPSDTEHFGNKNNTYSWYQEDILSYSTPNGGNCVGLATCDTQAYIQYANTQQMCGHDDWRLPNKLELMNLVDYGSYQPSIDAAFFPHTTLGFYWTSSIDTDDKNSIWSVDYYSGRVAGSGSNNARFIRLVRDHNAPPQPAITAVSEERDPFLRNQLAPQQRCNALARLSAPIARFKKDPYGNVLDTATGLIWKRCVAGKSGEHCETGSAELYSWEEALDYAASETTKTPQDPPWRVPNIKELHSTIETQCEEPILNPFVFPNAPLDHVWSSTPHKHFSDRSFYYQYQNGIIFYGDRKEKKVVHLVKDCRA